MAADMTEFKKLIKQSLESKGVLNQIQASIRSEVYKSISEENSRNKPQSKSICQENLVINELIREYLEYNKHVNSLSVFSLETNTPQEGINREFVKTDLNLEESGSNIQKLPLIYGIISMLQSVDQHKNIQSTFLDQNRQRLPPSQVRDPDDEVRIGSEPRSMHSTLTEERSFEYQNKKKPVSKQLSTESGRRSAASVGTAEYSADGFEYSSDNESSSRKPTPSIAESGAELSYNGNYDEDDDNYEDDFMKSYNIEDLAPVE